MRGNITLRLSLGLWLIVLSISTSSNTNGVPNRANKGDIIDSSSPIAEFSLDADLDADTIDDQHIFSDDGETDNDGETGDDQHHIEQSTSNNEEYNEGYRPQQDCVGDVTDDDGVGCVEGEGDDGQVSTGHPAAGSPCWHRWRSQTAPST